MTFADTLAQDIRFGVRSIRRDAAAAIFMVAMVAIGIGASMVDRSVFARRFVAMLVAAFAAFGLILAALGIYAVISYSVTLRTQEISIRMALGATPGVLLASILGQTGGWCSWEA